MDGIERLEIARCRTREDVSLWPAKECECEAGETLVRDGPWLQRKIVAVQSYLGKKSAEMLTLFQIQVV